jgi:adenosylcobinamide-phosphate synthase
MGAVIALSPGGSRAAGIALAVLADTIAGDPRRWHPVAGYGSLVTSLEGVTYAPTRARGVAFTAAALALPLGLGVLGEAAVRRRPVAGALLTAVATWAALGGTSLAREGEAMAQRLERGELEAARERLSHLCARDPSGLPASELARATVESLAENTSDAVVAPLFWAAVAGVPGVLGYRAANTLDAMVGYRSERYLWFGWASARLDDVLNVIPARVTGALTSAGAFTVGGAPAQVWRVTRRDARQHPSPNAGWCEASAAAALGVRLGGPNVYSGTAETRPLLAAEGQPVQVADIRRAIRLGRVVALAATGVAVLIARVGGTRKGLSWWVIR